MLAVVDECSHLVGRHGERVAHHAARTGIILEVLYFRALLFQFLRCIKSDICFTSLEQLINILLINGTSFALTIWAILSAKGHSLVEFDAQPLERLYDIFLGSRHKTVGVGVFNTENKIALVLAGKQVVKKCGTDAANVQWSGRTWCKTHPYSSFFHR